MHTCFTFSCRLGMPGGLAECSAQAATPRCAAAARRSADKPRVFPFNGFDNIFGGSLKVKPVTMDPSSPDFLRRLRLTIQIHLIAVINGTSWGLILVSIANIKVLLSELLSWVPEFFFELCWGSAMLYAFRQGLYPRTFSNFFLVPQLNEDYEMEFEQPLPKSLETILPGLVVLAQAGMYWAFQGRPGVFDNPLMVLISQPSTSVRLLYNVLAIFVLWFFQPQLSVGFFGPSITATVVGILTFPIKLFIKLWRYLLCRSFIAKPDSRHPKLLPYQYKCLQERKSFRLLEIVADGRKISATLENFPLDACPKYWAVSYVWGSSVMDHTLILDGTPRAYLSITESCANVLGLLTPFHKPRYLWIDAICIDQKNMAEKALQIPLMAEIYSGAEQVVGCLSTKKFGTEPGIMSDLMGHLAAQSPEFLFDIIRYLRFTQDRDKTMRLPFRHRILDWEAFCFLLHHPYWRRAWIVQEVLMAKKLVFVHGDAYFSWKQYRYAVKHLYHRVQFSKISGIEELYKKVPYLSILLTGMADRLDMLDDVKKGVQGHDRDEWPSVASLVDILYRVESTLTRDQIFALLSLASDGDASALQPDYREEVSDLDVLVKVSDYYLKKGSLNLLLNAGLGYDDGQSRSEGWPTWIPVLPKPMRHRYGNRFADEAKAASHCLDYSLSDNKRILTIQGSHIDELVAVCTNPFAVAPAKMHKDFSETHPDLVSQDDTNGGFFQDIHHNSVENPLGYGLQQLSSCVIPLVTMLVEHVPEVYKDGTPWMEAIIATFLMGSNGDFASAVLAVGNQMGLGQDLLNTVLKDDGKFLDLIRSGDVKPEKLPIAHLMHFDFAVTRGGLMAWVPPGARKGDTLCFFKGVRVPFLLRPVADEGVDQDQFVGDSYVHGLMTGEHEGPEKCFNLV